MSIDFERYGVVPGDGEQRFGFFLPDTFGMMPFVSALEPLRAANRYSEKHLYSWHLYGERNSNAIANNAMEQAVQGTLADAENLDALIVCGPHEPHLYRDETTLRHLKRIAASGTRMGALDTGSYMLAQARLIGAHRCTIHWENMPGFVEEFPQLNVSSEVFEIDGKLMTCAGGDAALDMILTLIEHDHGKALTAQVSELFIHPTIRRSSEPQRMGITQRTGVFHPGLVDCVELMEANIEQPLSTQELANIVSISKRQLERLFKAHLHTTPTQYYQQIRLQAGLRLLEQTSLTVLEIAVACGFASAGHFSKRFRTFYGRSPRDVRSPGNSPQ